jgi:hypothetical protein
MLISLFAVAGEKAGGRSNPLFFSRGVLHMPRSRPCRACAIASDTECISLFDPLPKSGQSGESLIDSLLFAC